MDIWRANSHPWRNYFPFISRPQARFIIIIIIKAQPSLHCTHTDCANWQLLIIILFLVVILSGTIKVQESYQREREMPNSMHHQQLQQQNLSRCCISLTDHFISLSLIDRLWPVACHVRPESPIRSDCGINALSGGQFNYSSILLSRNYSCSALGKRAKTKLSYWKVRFLVDPLFQSTVGGGGGTLWLIHDP